MSEQSHDEINKIFQSKLKDTDSGDGYWNIPPDRIFDDAMVEVASIRVAKRKRRRRVAIIFFFVASGLLSGWLLNEHVKELNARILQLEHIVESNTNSISNAKTIESKESIIVDSNNKSELSSEDLSESTQIRVSKNRALQQSSILPSFQMEGSSLSETAEAIRSEEKTHVILEQEAIRSNMHEILAMQSLDRLSTSLVYSSFVPEMHIELASVESSSEAEAQYDVLLSLTPTTYFAWATMDNVPAGDYALTEYGNLTVSQALQFMAAFPISKRLSLTGGISYGAIRNQSRLKDQFEYDMNNEYSNPNGQQMYASDIDIMTPLGMYANATNFDVSNRSFQDGSIIENKTMLDQSIRVFSFFSGIRNSFKISERLSAYAGVGLSYSIIEDYCTDMQMQLYDGSDMIDEFYIHSEDASLINGDYFSVNGEMGVTFALGNNWGVNLSGTYNHGLTDLTRGSSRTFFNYVGFGTGVYLKL